MARSAAVTGKKKATLWGVIVWVVTFFVWSCVWFIVWISALDGLVRFGFDRVPRSTWLVLVILTAIGSIPTTAYISDFFTRFKEWAKKIEI